MFDRRNSEVHAVAATIVAALVTPASPAPFEDEDESSVSPTALPAPPPLPFDLYEDIDGVQRACNGR